MRRVSEFTQALISNYPGPVLFAADLLDNPTSLHWLSPKDSLPPWGVREAAMICVLNIQSDMNRALRYGPV